MRVFHFVIKKRKRALRADSFFFNDSDIFKNILSSQAILYSQNVFRGFFFFHSSLARDSPSRSLRACLRLTEKR